MMPIIKNIKCLNRLPPFCSDVSTRPSASVNILMTSKRYQRSPFTNKYKPAYGVRNKETLERFSRQRLELATPIANKPGQFKITPPLPDPKVLTKERKLPSIAESSPPYQKYSDKDIKEFESHGTYYDPLFNPHLHEERYKVNPDEEPFNAIYNDSKSELANEYTKVRNITTPKLWDFVEQLARIKIAPEPRRRKDGEGLFALPSGFVPPPENPPDLPYFVPRTRNYLLPVYYFLDSDPEKCHTMVKQVTGDLWKLEEDLRTHLETLSQTKRRILTAVHETDGRVLFRGRHIHEVADWLHKQGF